MKMLKFDDAKFSKKILKELKGKKFFAVSINNGEFSCHVPDDMMKSDVIFGCELLKWLTMKDSIIHLNESEVK